MLFGVLGPLQFVRAIGMGTGTVALVMFPNYLITGESVVGLASDILVVGMWLLNIALAE